MGLLCNSPEPLRFRLIDPSFTSSELVHYCVVEESGLIQPLGYWISFLAIESSEIGIEFNGLEDKLRVIAVGEDEVEEIQLGVV